MKPTEFTTVCRVANCQRLHATMKGCPRRALMMVMPDGRVVRTIIRGGYYLPLSDSQMIGDWVVTWYVTQKGRVVICNMRKSGDSAGVNK